MTAVVVRNPIKAEYCRVRDAILAAGQPIPKVIFSMALADRHGEALAWLKERAAYARAVVRRPGKFAAQVAEPTADTMVITRRRALANIEAELHDAGADQLAHLDRMAQADCSTDLGTAMRDLVDHERADRMVLLHRRLPAPPPADMPHAGPWHGAALPQRVPPVYAAVSQTWPAPVRPGRPSSLGVDWWAIRQQRWDHAGRVGDPSDTEYDDFFHQDRGGEGGSF